MLIQTKRAIDNLMDAGFSRDEFSVRTHRHYVGQHPETGKQMFEYGKITIVILTSKERVIELTKNLIDNGFTVTYILWQDERGHKKIGVPRISDDGKGQLLLWNTLKNDKNPLGEIYPVQDINGVTKWLE